MQNKSWEIIIAGILLLFAAIYVTSNKSDSNTESDEFEVQVHVNNTGEMATTRSVSPSVKIIDLRELTQTDELRQFEEQAHIQKLKSLEKLAGLIPQEARAEIIAEVQKAIRELNGDSTSISIDITDGKLVVNSTYDNVTPGTWSAVSPGVYTYMKEFNTPDLKKTTISIPNGSINIVGTGEAKARLVVHASGQIDSKESLSSYFNSRAVYEGQEAIFTFESLIDESKNNIQLQATLQLPYSTDVYSVTKAGHIVANNITGDQTYKTLGGHLELRDLSGDVTAFTEGGHIEVTDSKGNLIIESLGGHLIVQDSEGDITLKTSGGDIQALQTRGDLSATTGGGNITLRLSEVTGEVDASTGAGSLLLWLPGNANLNLNAEGSSFKIDTPFIFKGEKSKKTLNGILGTGGPEFRLKTSYGTVSVRKNE